jgi:hypothetical protein
MGELTVKGQLGRFLTPSQHNSLLFRWNGFFKVNGVVLKRVSQNNFSCTLNYVSGHMSSLAVWWVVWRGEL